MAMADEAQLASLVLLLRLPTTSSDAPNNTSELQRTLEDDDCRLLCFIGRLINSYASAESSDGVQYTLLRLGVRIVLMRYSCYATNQIDTSSNGVFDGRIFDWECCLLKSLLDTMAVNNKKHQHTFRSVDVEMSWSTVGILIRWSRQASKQIQPNKSKVNQKIADLWVKAMDVLMRMRVKAYECPSTIRPTSEKNYRNGEDDDESIMIQTITSILDGSDDNNITAATNQDSNSTHEFNLAVVTCFRSYLESVINESRLVTQATLHGMIHWSQQKDVISRDVYGFVMQYMNACLHHALGNDNGDRQHSKASYGQNFSKFSSFFFTRDINGKSLLGEDNTFGAIKSFLFYGLIVPCNNQGATVVSTNNNMDHSTIYKHAPMNRGEIYSLLLGFWQLLGPEWLYHFEQSISNSDTDTIGGGASDNATDWWQKSDFSEKNRENNNRRLGKTWQLCTLIRLAAGEFRLSMGRWMAYVEEDSHRSSERVVVSDIALCAQIVLQAVQLMTSLADDEDEDAIGLTGGLDNVWTPDAIIHIHQSLQDALNATIQYFNENDFTQTYASKSSETTLQSEWEDIGRVCCLVMGTIASELELNQLLNNQGSEDEEKDSSSFARALCTSISFCEHIVKKMQECGNVTNHIEHYEPFACLLPCIISILHTANDDEDVTLKESAKHIVATMCKERNFVQILICYMNRLYMQFEDECGKETKQQSNIVSLARLASIVANGLIEMNESCLHSIHTLSYELSKALLQWSDCSFRFNLATTNE